LASTGAKAQEIANTKGFIILTTIDNRQLSLMTKNKQIIVVLACAFLTGLFIYQLGTVYPPYIQSAFPAYSVQGASILFLPDTFLIVFFKHL